MGTGRWTTGVTGEMLHEHLKYTVIITSSGTPACERADN